MLSYENRLQIKKQPKKNTLAGNDYIAEVSVVSTDDRPAEEIPIRSAHLIITSC